MFWKTNLSNSTICRCGGSRPARPVWHEAFGNGPMDLVRGGDLIRGEERGGCDRLCFESGAMGHVGSARTTQRSKSPKSTGGAGDFLLSETRITNLAGRGDGAPRFWGRVREGGKKRSKATWMEDRAEESEKGSAGGVRGDVCASVAKSHRPLGPILSSRTPCPYPSFLSPRTSPHPRRYLHLASPL